MGTIHLPVPALVEYIDEPHRSICHRILTEHAETLKYAWGSSHNHQAWPGGYLDHVAEVMNLAIVLHKAMNDQRPLPFSLSDALLVLFLHDIEKPWRFSYGPDGERESVPDMQTKEQRQAFRERFLTENGIKLNKEQMNALTYVEGEHKDYTNKRRVMNELAAFCHMCDVASARLWHDCPRADRDEWHSASRTLP